MKRRSFLTKVLTACVSLLILPKIGKSINTVDDLPEKCGSIGRMSLEEREQLLKQGIRTWYTANGSFHEHYRGKVPKDYVPDFSMSKECVVPESTILKDEAGPGYLTNMLKGSVDPESHLPDEDANGTRHLSSFGGLATG